jgi:pyruvate/2-oxoglutarate dehydrogenase complex dihydrolipoamide dehydrogenase (E3) component
MTTDVKAVPESRSLPRQSFDAIIVGTGQAAPALASRLTASGMTVAVIERASVAGVILGGNCASGEPEIVGSHLLMAVGHHPSTDDLSLEKAGVACNRSGYIVFDDRLRTNVDGILALGDCNGRGAFTHTAYNDFEIVAGNLLDNAERPIADRIPAYGPCCSRS